MARSLILSWPAGVSRFYWYSWDKLDMGLVQPGSLELKPAAIAFDKVENLLTGGQLKRCTRDNKIWTCPLVRADGKRVWIVWTEDDMALNWSIPADWPVDLVETIDGKSFKPNGNSIQIGMAPVFLFAQSNQAK